MPFENGLHPHRRILLEWSYGEPSLYSYLIGNTKPLHIDLNGFTISPVRCLFLGSGDLRNALHLASIPSSVSNWEFHLVDINPSIVARNLIILRMLNNDEVTVNDIWAIWYDFMLDERLYSYLKKEIEIILNSNLDNLRSIDHTIIKELLRSWLRLFDSKISMEAACRQRSKHISLCFTHGGSTRFQAHTTRNLKMVANALQDEDKAVIELAQKEMQSYIQNGLTGPKECCYGVNITMLQPASGLYTGHYNMNPFQSYLPFENTDEQHEFHKTAADSIHPLLTYCQKNLASWLNKYRQNRMKIRWHFWCGDALNIALFHMPLMEYDLIHSSNLCDHLDMLNLLVTCVHLLRHRSSSRILTQSMKWRYTYARFNDYLSEVFNGVELSWLPSLLGLTCECSRIIGLHSSNEQSILDDLINTMTCSEYQTWSLAMAGQNEPNLRLNGTDTKVLEVFDKLAERCFYGHLTNCDGHKGRGHSTALTYYLFLRQYCYRACVQPDETFAYLFQRTCYRFRAYAASLRALHGLFLNEDIRVCTSSQLDGPEVFNLMPRIIETPPLQLLLIDCDESKIREILRAMQEGTFQQVNSVVVTSNKIEYNLSTGEIKWLHSRQNPIQFHLIDNFIFQPSPKLGHGMSDPFATDLRIYAHAHTMCILPAVFQIQSHRAILIDSRTWYPLAKVTFDDTITKSSISAVTTRDSLFSCFADRCDRNIHYATNDPTSNARVIDAFETKSAYHVHLIINSRQFSWTCVRKLNPTKKSLLLIIIFSPKSFITMHFSFACPLNLAQSNFELDHKSHKINITLTKNVAALLASITLKDETMRAGFDLATAKRWPPPRLANGRTLEPRLELPPLFQIGMYDSPTMEVKTALNDMFTMREMILVQRPTEEHLFRDPEVDLKESIKHMFLSAYCGRRRVDWYTTKFDSPNSSQDIRTFGDILFLYEGVFEFDNRPLLAVSYLDMNDIHDGDTVFLTNCIKRLILTESQLQAETIKKARQVSTSDPLDREIHNIIATKDELGLMQKLLQQNAEKTKGPHRDGLIGPWHASFVEPLRMDNRSRILETQLTKECNIDLFNEMTNAIGCRTCKKLPVSPEKPWSRCSGCSKVCYCSVECQKKDWSNHKKACRS